MGDRLVLWSGGGRYIASKDVANAAIAQSGGVRVDWGEHGTDEFPGATTAEIQSRVFYRWELGVTCSGCRTTLSYWYPSSSASFALISQTNNCGKLFGGNLFKRYTVVSEDYQGGYSAQLHSKIRDDFPQVCASNTPSGTDIDLIAPNGLSGANCWKEAVLIGSSLGYWVEIPGVGISTRNRVGIVPQVEIGGGCRIAITFTDDTTTEIPLDYCPDWVQAKPANSCPDGTIKQIDCGATTCCYACQDGRLILIDSFNKTS